MPPVDNVGTFFPTPDVQHEQSTDPVTVTAEHGQESTGLDERTPGNDVVAADWHGQESTGAFDQPGPETVVVPGFERPGKHEAPAETDADAAAGDSATADAEVQRKVVTPPDDDKATTTTTGAQTK